MVETMSDTDESGVFVDHPPDQVDESSNPPELVAEVELSTIQAPEAYQIVSIGSEEDKYAFKYHEDKLQAILEKIPAGSKVAVVSVVGAFRTGKSFILSWFLRYLDYLDQQDEDDDTKPWYERFQNLGNDGFEWKGGSERNTTGVWMWSKPHFLPRPNGGQPLAVLLVDTQGMFDHETTMSLTASIFGISTLLSSRQIYNVDKRIQEDNLQQLALFSEYARMAVGTDEKDRKEKVEKEDEKSSSKAENGDEKEEGTKVKKEKNDRLDTTSAPKRKPFQHIEFLVRDWQHFDDDEEEGDFEAMEKSMSVYLEKVIAEREARDLQETREQILSCFENITCFALCHPGFPVTKKKYSGDVASIEKEFILLLDRYCKKVFDPKTLEPKVIQGRELTADELAVFIKAYANLFTTGATFPTAATMLDATSSANNTNAVRMAVAKYKEEMDRVAGPRCKDYLSPIDLEREHAKNFLVSQQVFDSIANFGSKRGIEEARTDFIDQIESGFEIYESLNEGRNPLSGWETYGIPAIVAVVSAIFRWLTDSVCSAKVCRATSDFLSHTHATGWFFLAIVAITKFQQIKEVAIKTKDAVDLMMNAGPPARGKVKND